MVSFLHISSFGVKSEEAEEMTFRSNQPSASPTIRHLNAQLSFHGVWSD
jgi:hypothetical protein